MIVRELIRQLAALPADAPVTLSVWETSEGPRNAVQGDLGSVVVVRGDDGEIESVTLSEDEPS